MTDSAFDGSDAFFADTTVPFLSVDVINRSTSDWIHLVNFPNVVTVVFSASQFFPKENPLSFSSAMLSLRKFDNLVTVKRNNVTDHCHACPSPPPPPSSSSPSNQSEPASTTPTTNDADHDKSLVHDKSPPASYIVTKKDLETSNEESLLKCSVFTVDANSIRNLSRANPKTWSKRDIIFWLNRNPLHQKDNLILVKITHFRRHGVEPRDFEVLCVFRHPNNQFRNTHRKFWIEVMDLSYTPEYSEMLCNRYHWNWAYIEKKFYDLKPPQINNGVSDGYRSDEELIANCDGTIECRFPPSLSQKSKRKRRTGSGSLNADNNSDNVASEEEDETSDSESSVSSSRSMRNLYQIHRMSELQKLSLQYPCTTGCRVATVPKRKMKRTNKI